MIALLGVIAQLAIVAHAPDTASTCDVLEVTVAVSAPAGVAPRLVVPSFAPFDVLRSWPAPHVTRDQAGSMIAEYRYLLTTDRAGVWTIPPFEARVGGSAVRSRPLAIAVRQVDPAANVPRVVARARIDTSLTVSVRAPVQAETVYVGQQANYEVAVFLNQSVRDRLRRNPTFFPPDMQAMLAYDLPADGGAPRQRIGSRCFDALVYQRALFPLMAGRFVVPPAQLVYSLPLTSGFFSREETHEIDTDSTVVIAVDPPMAGRPSDYAGAVGRMRLSARLDTNATRVGDPLLLTVRVAGTGNVKLFPRPKLGVPWASLVDGQERVHVDTTARRIAGSKEFDWVLTPRVAGELDVPPIRYSYFDPDTRRYETTSTSPTRVHVGQGTLASADTTPTARLLALRPRYRGPLPRPLSDFPVFWAILALAPLPAFGLRSRERRRAAGLVSPTRAARLLAVSHDAARATDPSAVRRAFTAALAERLRISAESFTRPGSLARVLRRRGVSTALAEDAETFLRLLDEAAFSPNASAAGDAGARAEQLYARIDAEALPRGAVPFATLGIVGIGVLALGVATARAVQVNAARESFDRGVAAYERHDFTDARAAFVASIAAAPDAPDAWANLGTAAWAVADTARSVAGWQRALRLEPLASDVRDRVELAHALPLSAAGYVPPVSAWFLFDVAAILWVAGWTLAARRAHAGEPFDTRATMGLAAGAVVVLVAAFVLADRLAGRHAAVVRQTVALSRDPELGGATGPTAIVGEVVRTAGREGAWTRVTLDDGRTGWLSSAALIPLDARDTIALGAN